MKRLVVAGLATAVALLALTPACGKKSSPTQPPAETDTSKVYVVGNYRVGSNWYTGYWRDTVLTLLSGSGLYYVEARGMAVSGGTVYSGGIYNNGASIVPCYWRDTLRQDLPMDAAATIGYARGIAVQ